MIFIINSVINVFSVYSFVVLTTIVILTIAMEGNNLSCMNGYNNQGSNNRKIKYAIEQLSKLGLRTKI